MSVQALLLAGSVAFLPTTNVAVAGDRPAGLVATCTIANAVHPAVRGTLRLHGEIRAEQIHVDPVLQLEFAVAGLTVKRAGALRGADFTWYGDWPGPRDWPNVTVTILGGGRIATPPIDERELDMITASSRVVVHLRFDRAVVTRQFATGRFAQSLASCRSAQSLAMARALLPALQSLSAEPLR